MKMEVAGYMSNNEGGLGHAKRANSISLLLTVNIPRSQYGVHVFVDSI